MPRIRKRSQSRNVSPSVPNARGEAAVCSSFAWTWFCGAADATFQTGTLTYFILSGAGTRQQVMPHPAHRLFSRRRR